MTLTPKNLFNIILKIFGLFFLRELISQFLVTINHLVLYFTVNDFDNSLAVLVVSMLVLLFYVLLVLQLLFKTNKIVDLLKLDLGFEHPELSFDEIPERKLSLSTTEIFTISLIVIGGYILVEEIPNFCNQVYIFMQGRNSGFYGSSNPMQANFIIPAVKIIIGLLILGERKRIIEFIESRTNKDSDIE